MNKKEKKQEARKERYSKELKATGAALTGIGAASLGAVAGHSILKDWVKSPKAKEILEKVGSNKRNAAILGGASLAAGLGTLGYNKWKEKKYSEMDGSVASSKDMAIEAMKQERELMRTRRMRDMLRQKEAMARQRNLMQIQKMEASKEEQQDKAMMAAKKIEEQGNEAKNIPLFKTRAKTVAPVSMK